MQKKYLKEFVSLFEWLCVADEVIANSNDKTYADYKVSQDDIDILKEALKNAEIPLCLDEPGLMSDLFEEIEHNLYSHPESRVIYVEEIIRLFFNIAPYFDGDGDGENLNDLYPKFYGATISLINSDNLLLSYAEGSLADRYVLTCLEVFSEFCVYLDAKCLGFGIDLIDIQRQLNIFLFRQRATYRLVHLGYEDKLLHNKTLDTLKTGKKLATLNDDDQKTNVKRTVEEYFAYMLSRDNRKKEKILTQKEYDKLIDWVTYYFDNEYSIPQIDFPIRTINTAQGNIIQTFITLFDALSGIKGGARPESLFELIKSCLYEYRNKEIKNLKKATSRPKYYPGL